MKTFSLYRSALSEKRVSQLYDRTLLKWPVPYETSFISTRYGQTFIISSGAVTARPLILLHGLYSNSLSWIGDIRKYIDDFRVYAVDIPGEPGKSSPNRPNLNSPAFAEWLEDIINSLNIDKALLVGISYGGWIALKFAIYQPERIHKLAVVAPAGIFPIKKYFNLRAGVLSSMGEYGAKKLNRILAGNRQEHKNLLDFMDLVMTCIYIQMVKIPVFQDEALKRLTMPVLYMGGLKDPVQNINKSVIRMRKMLSYLTTEIFPGQGHIILNSADVIIPFLKNNGIH